MDGACLFQQQYLHHILVQQRRLVNVKAQRAGRRHVQLVIRQLRQSVPLLRAGMVGDCVQG